jgi:hypothetical protein
MKVGKYFVTEEIVSSKSNQDSPADTVKIILSVREGFPLLYKLLCSALTFGASTAVCGNSFSSLSRILTPFTTAESYTFIF